MAYFLLKDEAILMGLQLIVDHLVDLLLKKIALFLEQIGLLVELCTEGLFCHFKVVLDHQKRVL